MGSKIIQNWFSFKAISVACVLLLYCFFSSAILFAQDPVPSTKMTISGKVYSDEDRQSLVGVNIEEKGTSNGSVTDLDGNFSLTVPLGARLLISYIGYETKEVLVQDNNFLTIAMSPNQQVLQDVVVVGYRKEIKSDLATPITSLKSKDIDKLPVLGIDQALQGQVAGLQVTQATGAPGDDIVIRIRGVGTLGNNNPLFIVDGIPTTGNINMFSTNDIESIDVLKDGAAAAIYGARAANGVIIITTKKGKSGKPKFAFDAYKGFQEAYNLPEMLNSTDYVMIRNEAIANTNALRDPRRLLDPINPAVLDTLPNVNWLDEVFNPAPIERYNLSASGGNEFGSYYIMGEYMNQEGVFRGQGFEKYMIRFNGEAGSKRFKIGNNISFAVTDRDVIGSSGDGAGPGNELNGVRYALIAAPVFRIRNQDGSYVNTSQELGDPQLFGDGNPNPLAFIDATDWNINRSRVFGSVYAELGIMDGLSVRTNLGGDFLFQNEKIFKQRLSPAIYDPSSLTEGRVFDRNLVWSNIIDFQRSFGRGEAHKFSAILGMEAIQNKTDYLGASANNFLRTSTQFRYINTSIPEEISNLGASGIVTEWGLLSYFGRINYNYKNRYIVNAAIRRDGSSRFGRQNRYGNFPSLAVAWNVSNEAFFANVPFVSHLKIRASWGRLGNQEIGLYPFSSLVNTGDRVYTFGGVPVTGANIVETGNENIRWETTTQEDIGLEFSLWKDRISFMADYFRKTTSDVLVRVPVPQAGGSAFPPFVNAGMVENKGWDFALVFRNAYKDFQYSLSANISTAQNKVLSLAGGEPILGGFGLSDGPITRTEVGYPIGSFYIYQADGLFQTQAEIDAHAFQSVDTRPGDVKFADLNGDGIIDDKDRAHLGSPFPDFIYGFNLTMNYKNWDLSVLGQGVQGNDVYFLFGNFAYETQARGFNSYADILNRWTPENTNTDIPRVSIDDRNGNRRISTRFLEDGSYFRVRNITLGYNLKNKSWMREIALIRVYATLQNFFTFTKYSGLDPEIQANTNDTRGFNVSSDLAVGIDWGTVPAPRMMLAGIRIEF